MIVGAVPIASELSSLARTLTAKQTASPVPNTSGVRVSYDLGRGATVGSVPSEGQQPPEVTVRLPLKVNGLPPKTLFRGNGNVKINIGGIAWPEKDLRPAAFVEKVGESYWQSITLNRSKLDSVLSRRQPADLHASFNFEVVNDEPFFTALLTNKFFFVPGFGPCKSATVIDLTYFSCRVGLNRIVETNVEIVPGLPDPGMTAYPADVPWGLSPATEVANARLSVYSPSARLIFTSRNRITAFNQEMDLRSVHISDYISTRK